MSSSTATELASLPGLESAKRLVLSLAEGSPVQAVLFYGIQGSGKSSLARTLTKAWLCLRPIEGGACGECQACQAFERDRSADVLWLHPMGRSRNIRLAGIYPVDSPSKEDQEDFPLSAQAFLRTPPLSGARKIVVIQDADRLTPAASNALLKTLEEPPIYGRFILITSSVGAIIPTVLSRCLAVPCEVPSTLEDYEPWILELADNAPARAAEIASHGDAYSPLYTFAIQLDEHRREAALRLAEDFAGLADALQPIKRTARAANAEALEVLASAYSIHGRFPGAVAEIVEAHRRIIGNGNPSSVFDALFASILR